MSARRVVVPFAPVDPDQNPNIRERAAGLDPYYAAMVTTFASFARSNPDVELQLVTTDEPPVPWGDRLRGVGVEIVSASFEHRPPEGFAPRFLGALYIMDALSAVEDDKTSYFVDPDVLCVRPLDELDALCSGSVGAIRLDTSETEPINGLTRAQAWSLNLGYDPASDSPRHLGGEVYVVPAGSLASLNDSIAEVWEFTLENFRRGRPYYPTEEHVLMAVLHSIGYVDITPHARRIWTAHRYRTVERADRDLTLWHLPSEKDRGFAELAVHAVDPSSWFWTADHEEFIDRAGRAMGLWSRPMKRLFKDSAGQAVQRSRELARGTRDRFGGAGAGS